MGITPTQKNSKCLLDMNRKPVMCACLHIFYFDKTLSARDPYMSNNCIGAVKDYMIFQEKAPL